MLRNLNQKDFGPNRDLNPGPPAPKAGIIPLDHLANLYKQQRNDNQKLLLMLLGETTLQLWKNS